MKHPKDSSDRTTLAIMTALHAAGFGVLLPFGENSRYDLAIDDRSRLARIQCETGRLRNGAVWFNACSTYAHHQSATAQTRPCFGEVDFFAIHCGETGGVYLIPIEDLPIRRQGALRVAPARNRQRRGTRPAGTCEIGSVAIEITTSGEQA
jgi:hypothetical protein